MTPRDVARQIVSSLETRGFTVWEAREVATEVRRLVNDVVLRECTRLRADAKDAPPEVKEQLVRHVNPLPFHTSPRGMRSIGSCLPMQEASGA
ncbi:MAG: hypothetical protein ACYCW6_00190 [Candidatus Xenobia bacterium]